MPYCKNCGAYIPSDDTKCDECGTVNGKTPLMRLQKAIKTNGSIDDIIEKPEIDNSPIAMPKKKSKKIKTEPEVPSIVKSEEDVESKFSDYLVDDIPSPQNIINDNKTVKPSAPAQTNIVDPLSDLDDSFDMFDALGLGSSESSMPETSVDTDFKENEEQIAEEPKGQEVDADNTTLIDLDDDEQLDGFIKKYTEEKSEPLEDISNLNIYNNYNYEEALEESGNQKDENPSDIKRIEHPVEDNKQEPIQEKPISSLENVQSTENVVPTDASQNVDTNIKSKNKPRSKLPIILIAIVVVILAGYITVTQTGIKDKLFNKDPAVTTTLAGAVTTKASETTKQVNDSYSYADVYQATGTQAAQAIEGIVNGYQCGRINSVSIIEDGKVTLTTDEWEIIFRLKNPTISKDAFMDKSVMVVGSALYNTISAEKVYIYNSTDIIDIPTTEATTIIEPTIPDPAITEAPTEITDIPTESPTEPPTTKRVTTTKAKTTVTTTTAIPTVSIEYITEAKANQLMASWRADGTKLGDSNAYYGTIKSISASGDNITIKTAKFTIKFKSNDSVNVSSLIGKNILAVAKPQSDGNVRASQIYIYN